MDKVLKRISELIDANAPQTLEKPLERIQRLPAGNQIFKRITSSSDREQLEDCLAEVRYALAFVGLGFQVEIEPLGRKGPDMRISRDGHQAVVEVTRFRKIYQGPPVLDLSDENLVFEKASRIQR